MSHLIDRTGQKFNNLTIIEELGGGKVKCRCDCGNVCTLNKSNVVRGLQKTCGKCPRVVSDETKRKKIKDCVGQRFGRLVVVQELGGRRVLCHCDCGNDKIVNKSHLLHGEIRSCGCLMGLPAGVPRLYRSKVKPGQRFGRLVVLDPVGNNEKGSYVYRCKCDCGNTCDVSAENLINGDTKSCGCLQKEAAQKKLKENLADGTNIAKIKSSKPYAGSKTGVRGVTIRAGKYVANLYLRGKAHYLGRFDNLADAAAARKKAEARYFGEALGEYEGEKETLHNDERALGVRQKSVKKIEEKNEKIR